MLEARVSYVDTEGACVPAAAKASRPTTHAPMPNATPSQTLPQFFMNGATTVTRPNLGKYTENALGAATQLKR